MASKTTSDNGSGAAQYEIRRSPLAVEVMVYTSDGDVEVGSISQARFVELTTQAQRDVMTEVFDNILYPEALTTLGFA